MHDQLKISQLFDLSRTLAGEYLNKFCYPWQALQGLKDEIIKIGKGLNKGEYVQISPSVWVHKFAQIASSATIIAPTIICANAQIRPCAYIRGGVIIGENCMVGNSTEVKNSLFFDGAKAPHFNYVGDSLLGSCAHLGAGVITSNLKCNKTPVCVKLGDEVIQTNLLKVGAFVGDNAEVGCNCVLNPATIVGKGAIIYPLNSVRGFVPSQIIYKNANTIIQQTPRK